MFASPASRARHAPVLALLLLAACGRSTPVEPVGASLAGPGEQTGVAEAYFVLHTSTLQDDGWPEDFRRYGLFICEMAMSADDVAQVRQELPQAILLVYINTQSVPIYTYEAPIYQQLTAQFDSSRCLMNLEADRMISLTPDKVPAMVLMQETADLLVAFHRDVTMAAGWDGIYIDQCNPDWPERKKVRLQNQTTSFDVNGDQVADTIEELDQQYQQWRPYFVARLRQELPDAILLGNAGGPLIDPNLNGITLENVGTRFETEEARRWVLEQLEVSVMPTITGFWSSQLGSPPYCQELALELGGYWGDVTHNVRPPGEDHHDL